MREEREVTYLIRHGEPPVVRGWAPKISYECNIEQVDKIKPPIQNEPPCLPMLRNKVGFVAAGKGYTVDEEESEDNHDTPQNAPPESFVHEEFGLLPSIRKIFHSQVER